MTEYFEILLQPQGWMYLFLLSILEIVLGIDNIIFISIITDKLKVKTSKNKARVLGLTLALIIRFILLALLSLLVHLIQPIYEPWFGEFNYEDLVLLVGGVFLIYKSTMEMHHSIAKNEKKEEKTEMTFSSVVTQIVLVDLVFSFDSVISAIGMTNGMEEQLHANPIIIVYLSVLISMLVMIRFSGVISDFIQRNPTIKTIALSFLLMIGVFLVAEAFGHKVPKGYIYFGFAFSMFVEIINMRIRRNQAN
jgi:predicted tellurium resistance membrane protein TerC